jgi:hypothetical protein
MTEVPVILEHERSLRHARPACEAVTGSTSGDEGNELVAQGVQQHIEEIIGP